MLDNTRTIHTYSSASSNVGLDMKFALQTSVHQESCSSVHLRAKKKNKIWDKEQQNVWLSQFFFKFFANRIR